MQTLKTVYMSEYTRQVLRTLLAPTALKKGDGDFEIGKEVTKAEIRDSLIAHTGSDI